MHKRYLFPLLMCLFFHAHITMAALPPLDDQERELLSSHIVEGEVIHRSYVTEKDNLGTNKRYTIQVEISKVIKGDGLKEKQYIEVTYWKAGERPERWVGDGGQRSSFVVGKSYTLFLKANGSDGSYKLLHPNGSSPLKSPTVHTYSGRGISLQYPESWSVDDGFKARISLWPPEGKRPLVSSISIEPKPYACDALKEQKRKLLAEISTYIDSDVKQLGPIKGAQGFELIYSWKDDPAQQASFINHDRYICGENGVLFLLRYASREDEYQLFHKSSLLVFDSFKPGKTMNHETNERQK